METNESQPLALSKQDLPRLFQQHQVFSDTPLLPALLGCRLQR